MLLIFFKIMSHSFYFRFAVVCISILFTFLCPNDIHTFTCILFVLPPDEWRFYIVVPIFSKIAISGECKEYKHEANYIIAI